VYPAPYSACFRDGRLFFNRLIGSGRIRRTDQPHGGLP
jgi:hypothetical protein